MRSKQGRAQQRCRQGRLNRHGPVATQDDENTGKPFLTAETLRRRVFKMERGNGSLSCQWVGAEGTCLGPAVFDNRRSRKSRPREGWLLRTYHATAIFETKNASRRFDPIARIFSPIAAQFAGTQTGSNKHSNRQLPGNANRSLTVAARIGAARGTTGFS